MTTRKRGGSPQKEPQEVVCFVMSGWTCGGVDVAVSRDTEVDLTFGALLGPKHTVRLKRGDARELARRLAAAADEGDELLRRRVRALPGAKR